MTANIVARFDGYYIEYTLHGRMVDEAGPFDELDDAEAAADRSMD